MLSTSAPTNYWRRNALARVRFLQKEQSSKKPKRFVVSSDQANANKQHDKAVRELRKVKRNYFLERRPFL